MSSSRRKARPRKGVAGWWVRCVSCGHVTAAAIRASAATNIAVDSDGDLVVHANAGALLVVNGVCADCVGAAIGTGDLGGVLRAAGIEPAEPAPTERSDKVRQIDQVPLDFPSDSVTLEGSSK